MRAHGEGAWLNIGVINQPGDKTSFALGKLNKATLPEGVASLIVEVCQVTDSLTGVVIGFQLEDKPSKRYETEINRDRRTIRQRSRGSWTMEWIDPVNQKIQSVNDARKERRAMVASWFAHHFPGYFCNRKLSERFPTMELIVARDLSLPSAKNPSGRRHLEWPRILLSTSPYDAWDSPSRPGLQLGFEWNLDNHPGLHSTIVLDPSSFSDETIGSHRGTGLRAYSWYCNEEFGDFLTHCAVIEYLRTQADDLHHTRERLKLTRSKHRNIAKTLDEIGRFFDGNIGSPAVARELVAYSEHDVWFSRSCGDLGTDPWHDGERRKLAVEMQSGVRQRASRLMENEASLRTHFEQLTSVLSVRESIRLQRWTLFLSLIAVIVALGSLWIAIGVPPKDPEKPSTPVSARP